MDLAQIAIVTGLLGLWAAVLQRRVGPPTFSEPKIKFTHVLPTSLQTILFTYWAVYWPEVVFHLPAIAFQLAVAYTFDLLLHWSLRRPYRPGLAPVPVVLSMNLFVWLPDPWFAAVIVAAALTSKTLLRSDGRHIFNPAVFGLTLVAALCIGAPEYFSYQDVSHDFDRPPHMAFVVFALALIPQIRLGITPVAVGAAVTMVGSMLVVFAITGYQGGPSLSWPAWMLAMTLLAGDPATIPSTPTSRLLFGLTLGVAFYVTSRALLLSVGTDFFAKIIPIALVNLTVPLFDQAGRELSTRWPSPALRPGNAAYVAVWISFFVGSLITPESA